MRRRPSRRMPAPSCAGNHPPGKLRGAHQPRNLSSVPVAAGPAGRGVAGWVARSQSQAGPGSNHYEAVPPSSDCQSSHVPPAHARPTVGASRTSFAARMEWRNVDQGDGTPRAQLAARAPQQPPRLKAGRTQGAGPLHPLVKSDELARPDDGRCPPSPRDSIIPSSPQKCRAGPAASPSWRATQSPASVDDVITGMITANVPVTGSRFAWCTLAERLAPGDPRTERCGVQGRCCQGDWLSLSRAVCSSAAAQIQGPLHRRNANRGADALLGRPGASPVSLREDLSWRYVEPESQPVADKGDDRVSIPPRRGPASAATPNPSCSSVEMGDNRVHLDCSAKAGRLPRLVPYNKTRSCWAP